ncbi:MAG: flavoprotein, partial [Pseudonocardia sp.]|nr:flavoprotein [Pseudonocardia sp.]
TFGGGDADQLPARGALGLRAAQAASTGQITTVTGFRTSTVEPDDAGRLVLASFDGRRLEPLDEVVVLTGFRPDLGWLSEVRLDLDPVLQAPRALAPLIDPNVHSCGTVYPHGARELSHPEPGMFLVGMKSYGRAPTFLALTGYEQTRSVVAAIAGDQAAADRVDLVLPETGVCGGAGLIDTSTDTNGGCCAPAEPVSVSAGSRSVDVA